MSRPPGWYHGAALAMAKEHAELGKRAVFVCAGRERAAQVFRALDWPGWERLESILTIQHPSGGTVRFTWPLDPGLGPTIPGTIPPSVVT